MNCVPDLPRWFAIRMASSTSPARAARKLGVTVDELARVCANFPCSRETRRAVIGAYHEGRS